MLEWASEGDSLLAKELRQMVSEVRMGKPFYTVFSRIGMRYDIPEADELTLLIKHADQQGVEVARHLRSLNRDFRTRQEVEMNNEAAKIKPKVTMVLVLAAIVATWALVAGPPVQRALEQGFFNFGTF
jgi:Flp pilus assembly protein TadB